MINELESIKNKIVSKVFLETDKEIILGVFNAEISSCKAKVVDSLFDQAKLKISKEFNRNVSNSQRENFFTLAKETARISVNESGNINVLNSDNVEYKDLYSYMKDLATEKKLIGSGGSKRAVHPNALK